MKIWLSRYYPNSTSMPGFRLARNGLKKHVLRGKLRPRHMVTVKTAQKLIRGHK